MADTVKKTARNVYFIFRLLGFVLIFTMLWPLLKVLHLGNGNGKNGKNGKEQSSGTGDSLFAPLIEKIAGGKARADVPPH